MRSLLLLLCALLCPGQNPPTFRGGVAVVRVDVQVLSGNTPVAGLQQSDFVLKEGGVDQPVRYFGHEDQPIDLVLLLDVSTSMSPHISRVVEQAHTALGVLRPGDRVGIMVFDREARLRLPLEASVEKVRQALDETLHREHFRGGTDIHFGLYEAAKYLRREARPEARRATIILTDDLTERARKDTLVLRGFHQAEAVLCALVVEEKKKKRGHGNTQVGGVEELSGLTGGDSFRSTDAAPWLRTTLERLRRRYQLGFHLPEGLIPGSARGVSVELTPEAQRAWPKVRLQSRQTYIVPDPPAARPLSE
ncbi:MAG: VWA domain-containing protein [Bryobacteraceae bacterium]|nr:VWA domain-containing protein [Bryobacteraceae bacterium]